MKITILILPIIMVFAACNNQQDSIFKDKKVERAVRASLNYNKGQKMHLNDLDRVTEITITRCRDLTGIRYLHNLKKIYIVSGIKDFSELAELKALETIAIGGCKLSDLRFLSHLNKIENLFLDDNRIEDISPIGSLVQIKNLTLSNNNVKDASALSNLINLEYISAYNNSIEYLPDLSGCRNLKEIYFENNRLVYNSNFNKLKHVKKIWLAANKIDKIDWVASLDSIKVINLNENPVNCDEVYKNKKLNELIDKEILALDCPKR